MQGPQYAMLVHLAMMLSTVHGWVLPSDDKAHDSSLSSHESAITGGRSRSTAQATNWVIQHDFSEQIYRDGPARYLLRVSCDVVKIPELELIHPLPSFGTSDHAQPSNERHDQDGPAAGLGAA
jgi:hypothetical protein